jgi:cyclopropane fatty-acyl-phospholipid synthase-like methyltransferase
LQDPEEIVRPYVKEGMSVLDIGCGMGFFLYRLLNWWVRQAKLSVSIYREK